MGIDQKNLVLHFNPRFDARGDKQKIILNSKRDSVWGAEKRESVFPFKEGSDTKVRLSWEGQDQCWMGVKWQHCSYWTHPINLQKMQEVVSDGLMCLCVFAIMVAHSMKD
ncbi:unnamed protein product [Staurois parvus]|uniref:Galectin n=1 Tax=Staurois parvus TaxID=386267 RepID=A0ABN9EKW7_9NEOB|nr:unnamed protein product [Staurois parvus]